MTASQLHTLLTILLHLQKRFIDFIPIGKYGHAAIFHLVKHNTNHGAVDCMLCNLPASTADKPSLLRHQNVVTFFHEFGHIVSPFFFLCCIWSFPAFLPFFLTYSIL